MLLLKSCSLYEGCVCVCVSLLDYLFHCAIILTAGTCGVGQINLNMNFAHFRVITFAVVKGFIVGQLVVTGQYVFATKLVPSLVKRTTYVFFETKSLFYFYV